MFRSNIVLCLSLSSIIAASGCGSLGPGDATSQANTIRVEGSDTMVNLAQAWAEEYNKTHPDVSIQVSGGGSGVGIASLIDGGVDIANTSRKMKEEELQRAETNTGKRPQEVVVGLDALAVYVHKDNPLESISIPELAEIYGDVGKTKTWSALGVNHAGCKSDKITRVSRQSNSGTYHYFREAVLGDARDFKLGSIDQSGSKDVVALVSRTPCAMGYSGMGYKTDDIKWVKVAAEDGQPGVAPSVDSASDGSYPIARPLQIYTLGEPTGLLKEYIDWIMSDAGRKIVLDLGYVPIESPETSPVELEPVNESPADETPGKE
ncbi:MAG: PstS family phosphate ABC transporter substrate-binding protein [Pirellulaceae bacterium]|nr:PstS family phosphate ABC transporter substrate-binding protein [Pirellulaceae bacterium]